MLEALNREILWREFWEWKLCNVKITLILMTWHHVFRYRCDITIAFSFKSLIFKAHIIALKACQMRFTDVSLTISLSLMKNSSSVNFFSFVNFNSSTCHLRSFVVISSFIAFWDEFQLLKRLFLLINSFFFFLTRANVQSFARLLKTLFKIKKTMICFVN